MPSRAHFSVSADYRVRMGPTAARDTLVRGGQFPVQKGGTPADPGRVVLEGVKVSAQGAVRSKGTI